MRSKILGLLAVALLVGPMAHSASIGYRPGVGGFGGLGGASLFDGLFAANGDTTVLTDFSNAAAVSAADALWLSGGTNVLAAAEQTNLLAFLNAGGRAVYVTDRSDGGPWAVSTNSILGIFGGDDIITGGDSISHPVIGSHALVAGLTDLLFTTWSAVNPALASPTLLTANGMAAVYTVGAGELLFIGDTNWQAGGGNGVGTNSASNAAFRANIVAWLSAPRTVPEPGTLALLGLGLLGLGVTRRKAA